MSAIVAIERCENYEIRNLTHSINEVLKHIGGVKSLVKPSDTVLLKVNLLAAKHPDYAITTHPNIVRIVAEKVMEAGGKPFIGDSPGGAVKGVKRYFRETGMESLSKEIGIPLIDFETHGVEARKVGGRTYWIAKPALEADLIINLPKMKTHVLLLLTGAVKNMYGVIPGLKKGEYHREAPRPSDFAEIIVDIFSVVRPHLNIMDGIVSMEGDGPSSGNPRKTGLILASFDAVALDTVFSHIVGVEPKDIETTRISKERKLGLGDMKDIEIAGLSLEEAKVDRFRIPSNLLIRNVPKFISTILSKYVWVRPRIETQKCTKCAHCVESCPTKALSMRNHNIPIFNYSDCINCLCCHEMCQDRAVFIETSWLARRWM